MKKLRKRIKAWWKGQKPKEETQQRVANAKERAGLS